MELKEYQDKAMTTCLKESKNLSYMLLNLVGEVGEFASKVAKHIRKGKLVIRNNHLDPIYRETGGITGYRELEEELKKEAGDVLWQLSGLCSVMGWELEDIAQMNLDKLASRKDRGVIDGNGDNR